MADAASASQVLGIYQLLMLRYQQIMLDFLSSSKRRINMLRVGDA